MALCSIFAAGTAENLSIFDPASPQAESIRDLSVLILAIAAGIFLLVEIVLLYCIVRFRRRRGGSEPPQVYGSNPIEIAWTIAPIAVLFVLFLVVTRTELVVRAAPPPPRAGDNSLFVTVVGHQWWWEYRYDFFDGEPLGFTTANELHVPDNVYLRLESADVCHSFWVPRLAGKTDLIPGRTNHTEFRATQPGLFVGQCAEYCGTQHAYMLLRVQVEPPAEFRKWLADQRRPANPPPAENDEARAGEAVFLRQSCVNCHRIRGTPADGNFGPDLTHLMSRKTLAAGATDNTPEQLRAWIADPQKIKSGCLMPAFGLSENDIDLVVAYLRTLD